MYMRNKVFILLCCLCTALLASCYSHKPKTSDVLPPHTSYSVKQIDSISFSSTHHYTNGYNFVVRADSLVLVRQQPEEVLSLLPTDSFVVRKDAHVVVADIRKLPNDPTDSIWIQLATEDFRFGWVQESKMIPKVDPDDPISQFITTFSNVHLLIFLIVIVVISFLYLLRKINKYNAHIVHFHDIRSFYPTCLCLLVACSATLYALIQQYAPEMWRHFYFHPTLNPFSVPPVMSVFLCSVWAMLLIGLAAVDDARHQLPLSEWILYVAGLAGVCAVDYIVFSVSTLYHVGLPLFAFYVWFALYRYLKYSRVHYLCGNCGRTLVRKGRCPHCGVMNE